MSRLDELNAIINRAGFKCFEIANQVNNRTAFKAPFPEDDMKLIRDFYKEVSELKDYMEEANKLSKKEI